MAGADIVMRVHHLSCGSFVPPLVGHLVCHVLLCETDDGLVLVDTGLGLDDYAEPKGRMGPSRHLMRPVMDPTAAAVLQLQRRGFAATDVAHVVLTHLDFDHVGGLADFPHATVHTTADEHAAAITSPDALDRRRYRPAQWAHGPAWQLHAGRGDEWRAGLTGHEVLPGITLVPMLGHSRGHAAVAVDAGDRGLVVHAGDAAFDASSYADTTPSGRPLQPVRALRAFEWGVGRDRAAIVRNHLSLRRLDAEPGVTVVPAHDPRVFEDVAR
jgi:glyoxylase-like metal-dependent hydrolase (beta-lactamase superfamily II)